jgi:hypothetical protein
LAAAATLAWFRTSGMRLRVAPFPARTRSSAAGSAACVDDATSRVPYFVIRINLGDQVIYDRRLDAPIFSSLGYFPDGMRYTCVQWIDAHVTRTVSDATAEQGAIHAFNSNCGDGPTK